MFSSPEDFLLLLEREEERERERGREMDVKERNIDCLPSVRAPTGDRTHNLGMCPDWGSNPQTFGVQDNTPTN